MKVIDFGGKSWCADCDSCGSTPYGSFPYGSIPGSIPGSVADIPCCSAHPSSAPATIFCTWTGTNTCLPDPIPMAWDGLVYAYDGACADFPGFDRIRVEWDPCGTIVGGGTWRAWAYDSTGVNAISNFEACNPGPFGPDDLSGFCDGTEPLDVSDTVIFATYPVNVGVHTVHLTE